ncbi:hypothetical protein [Flavobacterium suncheonense]|uniref:Uncharacterized protein n=1 Tax=Flavobacterium suncheonense GH29-5 = DSM 17707 TaxID=1121899 RepID=A0A0A2MDK5_9FLAO|nr:hypothetical protein [Flavobacterium suncheonense]KGO89543.1 hypothetical protein Q764_07165 [Flavobacterium suncheonense GH29-5 = DSM 17707]
MQTEIIINIVTALFGGTGVITFWAARKERQVNAFEGMQKVYDRMVADTDLKMQKMQAEIDSLRSQLEAQMMKCNNCTKK